MGAKICKFLRPLCYNLFMPKVVILGYGEMFMNLIAGCLDAGCNVVGVFRYDKVRHKGLDGLILDIFNQSRELSYIKSLNLYEIKAKSANSVEFKKGILKLNPDIVFVATWGEKLKKSIIDLPKIATINVHPSLLPKYRGPNPYLQAIKHLEQQSGVTFHLMDKDFDTGPILLQKTVEITDKDTGKELKEKIATATRQAVTELIKELGEEIIIPVVQDEKKASYFSVITEDEVMLDFSKSAEELSAQIRAFHPWYKSYYAYKNQFFVPNPYCLEILENNTNFNEVGAIVDKAHKNSEITVLCGDGKLLKMSNVKLYGKIRKFFTNFYIKYLIKKGEKA